ncbi:MAG: efflux system, outer rane lipoprotein NodT family [Gammaproteobacteria bacterium]|nr:efflux system, outer rane lipoprotein NodT family [Gammaproteobacteria bacterium]
METDKLRRPRVEPRARLMNIRRQTSQISQLMRTTVVHIRVAAVAATIVLVAGCVGPAYVKPKVDTPSAFKESSPAAYTGADPGAWQPAQPQDAALKGKWWEVFGEPELNTLEDQLNIDNQNIAQFFQNFMAARAQVGIARASYFPTLTTTPSGTRTHTSGALGKNASVNTSGTSTGTSTGSGSVAGTSGSTLDIFQMPFDVSWAPDLWGRVRNTVRQARYAAQVSAADLENERLTEQAALAEFYFQLRGQDALEDLFNKTIEAQKKSLELTKVLFETGIDSPEDVAQAEVTLANTQATAVGVATNRAIYEHAIATLIGKPASDFSMPVKVLATPVPVIPVDIPSKLLQRRPDIAAAERTMAEANALIGVETAAYYPTLNLTAGGGWEASAISTLFTAPARFWSLGASASETIFDGGLRRATLRQYNAQFNADVAAYRQTTLTAFQQVEDYIATVRVLSQQIEREKAAVAAAQRFLDIATSRYQTGIDPYLNVITAQTTLLSDQQTEVSLRVSEMTAAVQLIQALGGSWDTDQLPSAAEVTSQKVANQLSEH